MHHGLDEPTAKAGAKDQSAFSGDNSWLRHLNENQLDNLIRAIDERTSSNQNPRSKVQCIFLPIPVIDSAVFWFVVPFNLTGRLRFCPFARSSSIAVCVLAKPKLQLSRQVYFILMGEASRTVQDAITGKDLATATQTIRLSVDGGGVAIIDCASLIEYVWAQCSATRSVVIIAEAGTGKSWMLLQMQWLVSEQVLHLCEV